MNFEKKQAILQKIKEYQRIILFRHFRSDGDAVGSTKGLQAILRLTYPEKEIYVQNADFSDYLKFLGDEDAPIDDALYADALGIVLDTATEKRISNPKYKLCRELIKIDHHIETERYGDLLWIEEERSSTCEMVVDFYDTFRNELKMNAEAATYLYTGMVTDSGRFRYRSVSGETLRLAGILLEQGIDTDTLYAQLYLHTPEELRFQSYVHRKMKQTSNGVLYLYISRGVQKRFGLSVEQASAAISHLDSIRGSLIWLLFVEHPKSKEIRVRLRSRFVTVSELAECYRGGGHACAAGATVYSRREARELIQKADVLLGDYKAHNEGWL